MRRRSEIYLREEAGVLLAAFELGGAEELVAASGGTAKIFEQSHKLSELISSSRIHLSSAHFFDSQRFQSWWRRVVVAFTVERKRATCDLAGPSPSRSTSVRTCFPTTLHLSDRHIYCTTDIWNTCTVVNSVLPGPPTPTAYTYFCTCRPSPPSY
jgi:hypothetical protein